MVSLCFDWLIALCILIGRRGAGKWLLLVGRYTCCSGPDNFCTESENATKITEISFHQTNNFFGSILRKGESRG